MSKPDEFLASVEVALGKSIARSGDRLPIPGLRELPNRRYVYVACGPEQDPKALARQLTNAPGMPMPQRGAAGESGSVTLTDGRKFVAITYSGDLEGWEKAIAFGAEALGVDLAQVSQAGLALTDGSVVPLDEIFVDPRT